MIPSPASRIDSSAKTIDPTASAVGLRWCLALITLLGIVMITVEIGARSLVPRISHIESRTEHEFSQAIKVSSPSRPVILFVGNSLLLEDVQFDRIKTSFAGPVDIRRLVVEQTGFYDWRYGLRRLFSDGARPNVVVLMLDVTKLVSDSFRGDYSAYRLTRFSDIPYLSRDLHLNPTDTAGLLFANVSMFYGLRAEIRKVILGKLMPDIPELASRLAEASPPEVLGEDRLRLVVRNRVQMLHRDCADNGARLILVLPPVLGQGDSTLMIVKSAAQDAGVETVVPFVINQYTGSDFRDGYHLNQAGADLYTGQLINAVRASLRSWL